MDKFYIRITPQLIYNRTTSFKSTVGWPYCSLIIARLSAFEVKVYLTFKIRVLVLRLGGKLLEHVRLGMD